MRSWLRSIATVGFLVSLPTSGQAFEWGPDGVNLGGNSSNVITKICIIPDGAGGAFIGWGDSRIRDEDIYLQRVLADGTIAPGWPADGLPVCRVDRWQELHEIAPDGEGGVLLVWDDHRTISETGQDTYAQRITGGGAVAPGWPQNGLAVTRAAGHQAYPTITPDGTGGAYVGWLDSQVRAQHLTALGSVAVDWPAEGMMIGPKGYYHLESIPDGQGGAVFIWNDDLGVRAQRLLPAGEVAPGWPEEGHLVVERYGLTSSPAVDGLGGFYVPCELMHWEVDESGGRYWWEYRVGRFLFSGAWPSGWSPDGTRVRTVNMANFVEGPRLATGPNGEALVGWQDGTILGAKLLPDGTLASGWWPEGSPVSGSLSGDAFYDPAVVSDGAGGAYFTWVTAWGESDLGVRIQHLNGDGAPAAGWPAHGIRVTSNLGQNHVTSDSRGGAIVTWSVSGALGGPYAQRFSSDLPVPSLPSLVNAVTTSHCVTLTWSAGFEGTVIVQRRTFEAEWSALGFPRSEASGLLVYEDRDVMPGTSYSYRLAHISDEGEVFSGETYVSVPSLAPRLDGFVPNPSIGNPTIAFDLAYDAPAVLDVFDTSGRLVQSRDVTSLGPGHHFLGLGDVKDLGSGMYWIRLTHHGQTLTTRGVIINK